MNEEQPIDFSDNLKEYEEGREVREQAKVSINASWCMF
jgi:hypothetical protein